MTDFSDPGNRIMTLKALAYARLKRRAVIVPGTVWYKPKPAAVILMLPGETILRLIEKGMYLYEKPKKGGVNYDRTSKRYPKN
jgi:hypothetical protein